MRYKDCEYLCLKNLDTLCEYVVEEKLLQTYQSLYGPMSKTPIIFPTKNTICTILGKLESGPHTKFQRFVIVF